MKIDFHSNSIFIVFIAFGIISLYFWWRTVNKLSNNDKVIQGLDMMSRLVLSLSFVLMVYEHNRKNDRQEKERILQLILMNREYWLRIMEFFMKYPDDLTSSSNEIFLGMDTDRTESEKTDRQKVMEHFVIELMFQMLVDAYRLYDVNYLPEDNFLVGQIHTN